MKKCSFLLFLPAKTYQKRSPGQNLKNKSPWNDLPLIIAKDTVFKSDNSDRYLTRWKVLKDATHKDLAEGKKRNPLVMSLSEKVSLQSPKTFLKWKLQTSVQVDHIETSSFHPELQKLNWYFSFSLYNLQRNLWTSHFTA